MFKIGVFGDTGMVGTIITQLLSAHKQVQIVFRKNSTRTDGNLDDCDLCFLATKDAESMRYASEMLVQNKIVIDMSGAFRLPCKDFEKWYEITHSAPLLLSKAVYGMPALYAEKIRQANLIANPGCFATSVILALRPLVSLLAPDQEAIIVSTSGNSGARKESELESNDITYSFGKKHKHVPEMNIYSNYTVDFTPVVLRSVFRGINTNIRVSLSDILKELPNEKAQALIEERIRSAYIPEDLIEIVQDSPDYLWGTRDVNNTNKMLLKIRVEDGFAYICSMLDNLIKGAAGQAIENMNIVLGLPRLTGIAS